MPYKINSFLKDKLKTFLYTDYSNYSFKSNVSSMAETWYFTSLQDYLTWENNVSHAAERPTATDSPTTLMAYKRKKYI